MGCTLLLKNKSFIRLTCILLVFTLVITIYVLIFSTYIFFPELSFLKWINVLQAQTNIIINIMISYIAAYIFYIFQYIIPQQENNKTAKNVLKKDFEQYVEHILFAIFLFQNMTFLKNESTQNDRENYLAYVGSPTRIYYIYENKYLKRFTLETSLATLKSKVESLDNKIKSSAFYTLLDPYVLQSYTNINYVTIFDNLELLLSVQDSNINFKTSKISELQNNIEKFVFLTEVNTQTQYKLCNDTNLISRYTTYLCNNPMENTELMFYIPIN